MIYFLVLIMVLLVTFFLFAQNFMNYYDYVSYQDVQKLESLRASYYICSNGYDVIINPLMYKPKEDLSFNSLKGCKQSILSFGFNNDNKIPSFLQSYCNFFFPNQKVFLKIEKFKLKRGIKKYKDVSRELVTITNATKVLEYKQFCSKVTTQYFKRCVHYYIPSYIINENGKTKGFYVYKFTLCYY